MKDETQESFQRTFERLVAHELPHARRDPHRMSALIETLSMSLALAIATAAGGEKRRAEGMMQAAEAYIAEKVTGLGPIAKIIKGA